MGYTANLRCFLKSIVKIEGFNCYINIISHFNPQEQGVQMHYYSFSTTKTEF